MAVSDRESALWFIVRAATKYSPPAIRSVMQNAATILTSEEIYLANTVIALFQFYNTWVDLHGVQELTSEGYEASGVRLATHGYK